MWRLTYHTPRPGWPACTIQQVIHLRMAIFNAHECARRRVVCLRQLSFSFNGTVNKSHLSINPRLYVSHRHSSPRPNQSPSYSPHFALVNSSFLFSSLSPSITPDVELVCSKNPFHQSAGTQCRHWARKGYGGTVPNCLLAPTNLFDNFCWSHLRLMYPIMSRVGCSVRSARSTVLFCTPSQNGGAVHDCDG